MYPSTIEYSGGIDALIWVNNFKKKKVASSHVRIISPIMKNPEVLKKYAVVELHNTSDIPFSSSVIRELIIENARKDVRENYMLFDHYKEIYNKIFS